MNVTQDYPVLLDLFIKLVESQAGKEITQENEWLNDAQALSKKLFQHLTTMQMISAGTSILIDEKSTFSFIDHSSVIVIARAAMETFLIFYHIYGGHSQELSRFNHKLWVLSGLIGRQSYPTTMDKNSEKLKREKIQINQLMAEIQSDVLFNTYTEKQKKQLLKGNWDFDISWQSIGENAGFHPVYFKNIYNFLCGYSHASYISALQIGQAKTIEDQSNMTSPMLQVGAIVMAYFIFLYPKIFFSANKVLEDNPVEKNVAERWHLTKEVMTEIYG